MKILPVEKTGEADRFTIEHEPIADIDLMERAAGACFQWFATNIPPSSKIKIFCGTGNNGGDGLAFARMLCTAGYKTVVYIAGSESRFSSNALTNFHRAEEIQEITLLFLKEGEDVNFQIEEGEIVIDALFGSGLSRKIEGFYERIILKINESHGVIVSIDVPSGLFCDESMAGFDSPPVIMADHTLTFAPPKLAFFFPENEQYVGELHLLEIGIHPAFLELVQVRNFLILQEDCRKLLRRRNQFAHKGNFGHALLIAGSYGKTGAAVLATRAVIRAGVGLVTTHLPKSGISIIQTCVPEGMVDADEDEHIFTGFSDLSKYSAIGIGPGIGQAIQTQKALKLLIQESHVPLVLDADALNILGENRTWLSFLPKGSILTPHMKEFERVAGKTNNDFDRNRVQCEFSVKYGVYVVLKGAHTAITTPEGHCFFNSTGNPGMATGGSGDTLTGIITALLAQGYPSLESAILGVYLHGLAGDFAASETGEEALIASDIIDYLGKAFKSLYHD
ncbi:MAG: NAD(P)H-hydrate dehydratase [Bacteroidota bacterium]